LHVFPRLRGAVFLLLVALLVGGWPWPACADLVRYRIDLGRSALTFKATSRVVNADGRFHRFGGDVSVDPRDPTTARISITIEAASIDTANTKRDNHLRSPDFFWVERHPIVMFESVRAARAGDGGLTVVGQLTLRGVTREISVPTTVSVNADDFVAEGEFELKRSDYEITYQSLINPVGDVVHVKFHLRGTRSGS
jgi:polyisoprenoid-binding protein YceI